MINISNFSNYSNTISVCIPTYNRAGLIGHAINSVLNQTVVPKELIISDNFSSDETQSIVEKFNSPIIKYHSNQTNLGMCSNFNKCLELASGDVVTLLHSDDWYFEKTTIETVLIIFEKNPNASILYSNHPKIGNFKKSVTNIGLIQDGYKKYVRGKEAALHVFREGQLPCSSTFYRRDRALACGGFSEEYSFCCDEEFNSRMALQGDIICYDHPLACYRRHAGHTMYDTWLSPNFINQYYKSRIQMASNAGFSEKLISKQIINNISGIIITSSHMAFYHGRTDSARALHRNLLQFNPAEYMKARSIKYLLIHYLPKMYTLYQFYKKYAKN